MNFDAWYTRQRQLAKDIIQRQEQEWAYAESSGYGDDYTPTYLLLRKDTSKSARSEREHGRRWFEGVQ